MRCLFCLLTRNPFTNNRIWWVILCWTTSSNAGLHHLGCCCTDQQHMCILMSICHPCDLHSAGQRFGQKASVNAKPHCGGRSHHKFCCDMNKHVCLGSTWLEQNHVPRQPVHTVLKNTHQNPMFVHSSCFLTVVLTLCSSAALNFQQSDVFLSLLPPGVIPTTPATTCCHTTQHHCALWSCASHMHTIDVVRCLQ